MEDSNQIKPPFCSWTLSLWCCWSGLAVVRGIAPDSFCLSARERRVQSTCTQQQRCLLSVVSWRECRFSYLVYFLFLLVSMYFTAKRTTSCCSSACIKITACKVFSFAVFFLWIVWGVLQAATAESEDRLLHLKPRSCKSTSRLPGVCVCVCV